MKLISIVVPCYNEEETIPLFYDAITKILKSIEEDYEIIFINDGSTDNSLTKIKDLKDVKYLSFSRNFGKEAALYAGLENSQGDYVVVMDVDLQDPPELIIDMLDLIKTTDFDIIGTRRVSRKGEPPIRSFFARLFYKLMNRFSNVELVDGARDFRLMTRQVIDAILRLDEYNRFSKGLFQWVGFKTKWLEYENVERAAGETSWSFWGLVQYSIEGIVSFTTAPLSISTFLGIIFSIIAFLLILFVVLKNLLYSDPVQGWASTICIILLLGGVQLFSIGILGKYLEKTYLEVKNRPIYLIKETNIEKSKNRL
ncbi:glycosyltransferase family 2 protein [uncultured Methanobrevibacter sp.]|uniref:glycosyltransferase family 2 protein n=1 Tax=uncultured Methanobrevibacter sp. TaxID=253161 RepID=UPI00260B9A28